MRLPGWIISGQAKTQSMAQSMAISLAYAHDFNQLCKIYVKYLYCTDASLAKAESVCNHCIGTWQMSFA